MALTEVNSLGIKDLEVKTADIAADAVTGAKIADDQIDSEHYVDGSIDTAHIADDAVTLAKLASGTDGQIISWDASGNPVAIGPGNDGQVLTSTGAGSPPAFEAVPAGGATINNATENEIVTVASTTTQLDAEANLTFDGNNLKVGAGAGTHSDADDLLISKDAAISGISIQNADDGYGCLNFGDASDNDIGRIAYNHNGNHMTFAVNAATRMEIEDTGDVKINDGNLIIGTAGHGIDFSATAQGGSGNTNNELLADYEEGVWTPTISVPTGTGTLGSNSCVRYQKVGNAVHVWGYFLINWSEDAAGIITLGNLPYACANLTDGVGGGTCMAFGSHNVTTNLMKFCATNLVQNTATFKLFYQVDIDSIERLEVSHVNYEANDATQIYSMNLNYLTMPGGLWY